MWAQARAFRKTQVRRHAIGRQTFGIARHCSADSRVTMPFNTGTPQLSYISPSFGEESVAFKAITASG
jgi:hypothetical protein